HARGEPLVRSSLRRRGPRGFAHRGWGVALDSRLHGNERGGDSRALRGLAHLAINLLRPRAQRTAFGHGDGFACRESAANLREQRRAGQGLFSCRLRPLPGAPILLRIGSATARLLLREANSSSAGRSRDRVKRWSAPKAWPSRRAPRPESCAGARAPCRDRGGRRAEAPCRTNRLGPRPRKNLTRRVAP